MKMSKILILKQALLDELFMNIFIAFGIFTTFSLTGRPAVLAARSARETSESEVGSTIRDGQPSHAAFISSLSEENSWKMKMKTL